MEGIDGEKILGETKMPVLAPSDVARSFISIFGYSGDEPSENIWRDYLEGLDDHGKKCFKKLLGLLERRKDEVRGREILAVKAAIKNSLGDLSRMLRFGEEEEDRGLEHINAVISSALLDAAIVEYGGEGDKGVFTEKPAAKSAGLERKTKYEFDVYLHGMRAEWEKQCLLECLPFAKFLDFIFRKNLVMRFVKSPFRELYFSLCRDRDISVSASTAFLMLEDWRKKGLVETIIEEEKEDGVRIAAELLSTIRDSEVVEFFKVLSADCAVSILEKMNPVRVFGVLKIVYGKQGADADFVCDLVNEARNAPDDFPVINALFKEVLTMNFSAGELEGIAKEAGMEEVKRR
ncbi:MAG: hypothetical protein V1679_02165 [Candidatus Peregrinibacteria bacterium]